MDSENWNKFCNAFNLDVKVTVKKEVTRSDILQTLVNEGEFIFKGKDGSWVQMNLTNIVGKAKKNDIKLLDKLLWGEVVKFITPLKGDKKS